MHLGLFRLCSEGHCSPSATAPCTFALPSCSHVSLIHKKLLEISLPPQLHVGVSLVIASRRCRHPCTAVSRVDLRSTEIAGKDLERHPATTIPQPTPAFFGRGRSPKPMAFSPDKEYHRLHAGLGLGFSFLLRDCVMLPWSSFLRPRFPHMTLLADQTFMFLVRLWNGTPCLSLHRSLRN